MVERLLSQIKDLISDRANNIAIFIMGASVNDNLLDAIPILKQKIKDVGELKISTVLFEGDLPQKYLQKLQNIGFSHKIIPTYEELHFLIDVYDHCLNENPEIIILGTTSKTLLPLYTEIRRKSTVYALVPDGDLEKAFESSFDGIIRINDINSFSFGEDSYSEFSVEKLNYIGNEVSESADLANIGITSEKIVEEENT